MAREQAAGHSPGAAKDPLMWLREQFPQIPAGKFWVGEWSKQFAVTVDGRQLHAARPDELAEKIRTTVGARRENGRFASPVPS